MDPPQSLPPSPKTCDPCTIFLHPSMKMQSIGTSIDGRLNQWEMQTNPILVETLGFGVKADLFQEPSLASFIFTVPVLFQSRKTSIVQDKQISFICHQDFPGL